MDRYDGSDIGDPGELVGAGGGESALGRQIADVIPMEVGQQKGVDRGEPARVEAALRVASNPLTRTTFGGRQRFTQVGRGAVDRTGVHHEGGAVGENQQSAVAAVGSDLVNFKYARLPWRKGCRDGCGGAQKRCGEAFAGRCGERTQDEVATRQHAKL